MVGGGKGSDVDFRRDQLMVRGIRKWKHMRSDETVKESDDRKGNRCKGK